MDEVWKPIVGHERYQASTLGRIKNIKGEISKLCYHRQGYLRVMVDGKARMVHRLIAMTFIPNPENKKTVNHINANKEDNRVENLEWATQSENNQHAVRNHLKPYTLKMWVSSTKGRKIAKEQAKEIELKRKEGYSLRELSVEYGISDAQVSRIANGKSRHSIFKPINC